MKNTSIVKRYYAMNLNDGRILLATRELLTNPDYRVISEALARNIERVQTDWRKIAFELRQRDNMRQMGLPGSNSDLPFSMTEASNAFTAQLYTANRLEVTVTNHQLTIGIKKTQKDGCDWTVWDNFQLTLLEAGDNSDYDVNNTGTDVSEYDDVTPDNPLDMTSRIVNPQFDSASGWTGSPVIGGASNNLNAEKYNTTFDVYQTLYDMPNGWYCLKAQGFYRYGDYHEEQHK